MLKIVTGTTGEAHVTSDDEAALNQGAFGSGSCILNVGNKLAATVLTANSIKLEDGEFLVQGKHGRITPNTYETVSIDNGQTGYNRNDIIAVRYSRTTAGIESFELIVINGTASTTTAVDPTYTIGNMRNGDTSVLMPLYRVRVVGLTIDGIDRMAIIGPCEILETGNWLCKLHSNGTFEMIYREMITNINVPGGIFSGVYDINIPSLGHSLSPQYLAVNASYTDALSTSASWINNNMTFSYAIISPDAFGARTTNIRIWAKVEGTWQ